MGLREDLIFRLAKRWISGKDLGGALEGARHANGLGMGAILNYLGEDVTELGVARRHAEEYARLQRAISENQVDGCVSVKLTQLGLLVDKSFVFETTHELAAGAEKLNQAMWIDMEGSRFTTETLRIYSDLFEGKNSRNVGVALQANLKRSEKDLSDLLKMGARVRLVKGAYKESPELIFGTGDEVRTNYSKLMRLLFERGQNFAIGTHDSNLVDEARILSRSNKAKFEFEMLRGIRNELKVELAQAGYRVVEYIPYGEDWYAYSMRRIKEHPSNIWLLLRSLV